MARIKGTVKLSSNIEPRLGAPLDARQRVFLKDDLTNADSFPYPWIGMEVFCAEDGKKYRLISEDTTSLDSWFEIPEGESSTIQVEEMPAAGELQEGKIYQYIGETDSNYTNGYFYICSKSGETQTVDITTLVGLKETINESENVFEVNSVETKVFTFDSVNYYVFEDVVYSTSNATGDTSVDTVLSTDEEVVALNLTKEVVVYTYSWSNKAVQPTTEMGDALPYGAQFPENPEDGDTFLYVGPDIFTYQVATGLTPNFNPQAMHLYEENGLDEPIPSSDTQALVNLSAWSNGSETLFTIPSEYEDGAPVWSYNGSEYQYFGEVTEYTIADGITVNGTTYARDTSADVTGKTYYQAIPDQYGNQVYKYDLATTSWINVSRKNVVKGAVTKEMFKGLFDLVSTEMISGELTLNTPCVPYHLYYKMEHHTSRWFIFDKEKWIEIANITDAGGYESVYNIFDVFTLEIYLNILVANNGTVGSLPSPTEEWFGKALMYVGADDTGNGYYCGHIYKCERTVDELNPSYFIYFWKEVQGNILVDNNTLDNLVAKYGSSEIDINEDGEFKYQFGHDETNTDYYYYWNGTEWTFVRVPSAMPPEIYQYGERSLEVVVGIMLANGSSGGGDAEDITYSNTDKPELTNVKLALDDLIAKVYYVEPQVTSFTMTPATTEYEIGQSVSDLVFAWTYNKDMASQTLTDCTLADETVRTATAAGPYTSNKTFTLSASDGENDATASKSISFKHKVYWGSAATAASYDSTFILGLSGKKFATATKGTYTMTVASGEYGFLAYPDSWGLVESWWIGGFEVETFDCGTVSFTNASGNTTTFRVIRTTQPGLGSIAPEIK